MKYFLKREFTSFALFVLYCYSLTAEVDINYINQLSSANRNGNLNRAFVEKNNYGYTFNEVVDKIREIEASGDSYSARLLIRLNDQPTINKYLERFVDSRGMDRSAMAVLKSSFSPWIITELMQYTHAEEIKYYQHESYEVIGYYGLSATSLQTIFFILIRSQDFPKEVRAWAASNDAKSPSQLIAAREELDKFWEQNKEYFESERYDLVQPPIMDDETSEKNETTEEVGVEIPTQSGPEPVVAEEFEVTAEPEEMAVVSQNNEIEDKQDFPKWVIGAGVLFLILVTCLIVGTTQRHR